MMTIGVGGKTIEQGLAKLQNMTLGIKAISIVEYKQRLLRAKQFMHEKNIEALFITSGSNLLYFTGISLRCSERLTGAILSNKGQIIYIVPHFELDSFNEHVLIKGHISTWQEHEDPIELVISNINDDSSTNNHYSLSNKSKVNIALCGTCSFTITSKFIQKYPLYNFVCADEITVACRQIKSITEITIMQRVMDMTLSVHEAVASILYEGISSEKVESFINEAHKKVGAKGSYFCLVLFAEASALPHGIRGSQKLKINDMVLIDTGCKFLDYTSDITRSYVFGTPNEIQKQAWNAEKSAQKAAFNAAQVSNSCEYVDHQARIKLAEYGFSNEYDLPGLPHRTGHGIGIDIHESPYLVRGDKTLLTPGMCFSNEPTICIPGKFGIRLEDHFYMTEAGPKWFTLPSESINNPFNF